MLINSSWEIGVSKVLGVRFGDQVVKVSSENEIAIFYCNSPTIKDFKISVTLGYLRSCNHSVDDV